MRVLRVALPLPFLCFLLCVVIPVEAYLHISVLYKGEYNSSFEDYTDRSLFSNRFENLPELSSKVGHLYDTADDDACSELPPAPINDTPCFLLVYNYTSCPEDIVKNVREAGYKLIIVFTANDTQRELDNKLQLGDFPAVSIPDRYAHYLHKNALSNSSNSSITVSIEATVLDNVSVVFFPAFTLFLCITCVGFCCIYRRWRTNTVRRRMIEITRRQQHQQIRDRRERMARQALVQSILRQLQELQLDMSLQVPLGAEETARLHTRLYTATEEEETCAICVDEFIAGETVKVLPCNHFFHPQCIDEWLRSHSSLCPLCKMDVKRTSYAAPNAEAQPQVDVGQPQRPTPAADNSDSDSTSLSSADELLPSTRRGNGAERMYGSV